jgi:hypothetical protein
MACNIISRFEETITRNDIIDNIISFMSIDSFKNIVISSKYIYECPEIIIAIKKHLIKNKLIINKYITKYCRIIKCIKEIEQIYTYYPMDNKYLNAFYYYRYYPKEHIEGYFECVRTKLHLENSFFENNNLPIQNQKRSDLFRLIKLFSAGELSYIGW